MSSSLLPPGLTYTPGSGACCCSGTYCPLHVYGKVITCMVMARCGYTDQVMVMVRYLLLRYW